MEILTKIFPDLLQIWCGILPSMFLGLFIGNYLKQDNLTNRIKTMIKPFTSFARLSPSCSLPIALCFLDRIIGFTILKELYKEEKIEEKELVVSTLIAKIVMSLYPLIFLLMPLLISTLGLKHGLQFFFFYTGLFLLTSLTGLFWGRLTFKSLVLKKAASIIVDIEDKTPPGLLQKVKIALNNTIQPFKQMVIIFLFFSFLALWLVEIGVIDSIISKFKFLLDFLRLAPSSTAILAISTGTVSMLAAIASIGSAFQTGLVNFHQVVLTLLVASFLHNLYELWSHDLPINISIFGSKLGTKVSFINFFIHETFIFLALMIWALLFK